MDMVNHHADHPGFSGITGALCGIAFLLVGRRHAELAVEVIRPGIGDHLVDIGCGPGNAARAAARCGARVTGVDPAPVMLRIARAATRRGADITWADGGAESLPLPDGSATAVWALATVHHWRDVSAGLAEVHRVLAAGGRLLAVERKSPPNARGLAGHGWTVRQAEQFADMCRTAGLNAVEVRDRDSLWTVTARRGADPGPALR
ncbi:class I SAM-dependent methyltransferase [Mycobacterium sp. AMU20-3851]|uniref:class I SAM-dependent methyltransferase n=1 Tax=Mycobacterium sp. AMU20-3851 TaxID=3122055 RepID=UPI00375487BA